MSSAIAPPTPRLCMLLPWVRRYSTRGYGSTRRQAYIQRRVGTSFTFRLRGQQAIIDYVNTFCDQTEFNGDDVADLVRLLLADVPSGLLALVPLYISGDVGAQPYRVAYIARSLGVTAGIHTGRIPYARYVVSITLMCTQVALQPIYLSHCLLYLSTKFAGLNVDDLQARLVGVTFQQKEDRLIALAFYDASFEEVFIRALHHGRNGDHGFFLSHTEAHMPFPILVYPGPGGLEDEIVHGLYNETLHLAIW